MLDIEAAQIIKNPEKTSGTEVSNLKYSISKYCLVAIQLLSVVTISLRFYEFSRGNLVGHADDDYHGGMDD